MTVPNVFPLTTIDPVSSLTIVPVRGHVPRAFLRWFEELRVALEDQQAMLDLCHFEEDVEHSKEVVGSAPAPEWAGPDLVHAKR